MPDLIHCLHDHDLGFLNVIADLWGVELKAPDAKGALPELSRALTESGLVVEIIEALPEKARQAVEALIQNSGWMTWSRFTREYGPLREMGPGKRDREKPYLDPNSVTEMLWYRGLIGRDFLKREGELQECAYIPEDMLHLMPLIEVGSAQPPGRPASPGEQKYIIDVTDNILDHACTLLAALRLGDPKRSPAMLAWDPPVEMISALLEAMRLVTSYVSPVPEEARLLLELPRGDAMAWLVSGWRESASFNELRLMPGVICEGAWRNDPLAARERILEFLSEVPERHWWNLNSFIKAVYEREPDFQRPAGDFDSWLIRDVDTGVFLQGVQHWDQVDGALIHYLITGPMHWLGLVRLASPGAGKPVTAFQFSAWASRLLLGKPVDLSEEDQSMTVLSDGVIKAGKYTPRLARYQISRFCLWVDENKDEYIYQLTPASLRAAAGQGLKIAHLETLFKNHCETPPPSLMQALHQWEEKGGQARIHPCIVLRVEDPRILKALRESAEARFLGDPLGPASVIIRPGAVQRVTAALARLGVLSDVELTEASGFPLDEPDL